MPHSISLQIIPAYPVPAGMNANRKHPVPRMAKPMPPNSPEWILPIKNPATGPTMTMTSGQAVIMSPVSTGLKLNVETSMKGIATSPSICAMNDRMLVVIDIENMGMRSKSNGSMGYFSLNWILTYE